MPKDFSHQDLRGKSFKNQDLTGADFSHADIRGVSFKGAILKGANFTKIKRYNLSEKNDIYILERQSVYAYLKYAGLDYSKNYLLKQYLEGIDNINLSEIPDSDITSLEILGNYLERLIPPEDRKLNGAFFTSLYS
jgi:uncharacterized protein YjbI with pentapeptide repeats